MAFPLNKTDLVSFNLRSSVTQCDMAVGKSLHLLDLYILHLSKKNNNILPAILYEIERIYNFVSKIEMAVIIIFY